MPMAQPMIDDSAIGVLKHRSARRSVGETFGRLEHAALAPGNVLAEEDGVVVGARRSHGGPG
jgi:hypothetical protein